MSQQTREREFAFPIEIKNLISPLKNEKHWKILELVLNHDNKMTYTNIRKKMQFSEKQKGTLNYHLNELEKGGWLRNFTESGTDVTDRYSSYYSVTKFGQKVLDGIMQAMKKSVYPDQLIEYSEFIANTVSSVDQMKNATKNTYEKSNTEVRLTEDDLMFSLESIGLEKIEAMLYLTLLRTGNSTVGNLAKRVTVDRGMAYRSLNRLRDKGFITTTFSNPVLCTAIEPEKALNSLLQRKEDDVLAARRIISIIKEHLRYPQGKITQGKQDKTYESGFTITQGRDLVYSRIGQLILDSSKIVYIVAPVNDILRMYHSNIPERIIICKTKGGIVRLLTYATNPDVLPLIERLNATEVRIGPLPSKSRMIVSEKGLIMSGAILETMDPSSDNALYTDAHEMIGNMSSLCAHLWNKAKPVQSLYDTLANKKK